MIESSEEEYISLLKHQRNMYRWCLEHIGMESEVEAAKNANLFYQYQSEDNAYRSLVFHDDAWHWAMLHIKGEGYWRDFPDLAQASSEYESEWDKTANDRSIF